MAGATDAAEEASAIDVGQLHRHHYFSARLLKLNSPRGGSGGGDGGGAHAMRSNSAAAIFAAAPRDAAAGSPETPSLKRIAHNVRKSLELTKALSGHANETEAVRLACSPPDAAAAAANLISRELQADGFYDANNAEAAAAGGADGGAGGAGSGGDGGAGSGDDTAGGYERNSADSAGSYRHVPTIITP